MRNGGRVCAAVSLMVILAGGLVGCSPKPIWRASSQMCRAHGGTYSAATQECTFAAATSVSGQKACEDLGGTYVAEWQRCQFDD